MKKGFAYIPVIIMICAVLAVGYFAIQNSSFLPKVPFISSKVLSKGISEVDGLAIYQDIVYVTDGLSGLHIIDYSDPNNPIFITTVNLGTFLFNNNEKIRIVPWKVKAQGGHLFVATQNAGIFIYGLSDPRKPELLGKTSFTYKLNDYYPNDEFTAKEFDVNNDLMVLGNGLGNIIIADIKDPSAPRQVTQIKLGDGVAGLSIQNNTLFVLVSQSSNIVLVSMDITSSSAPKELGRNSFPVDKDYSTYHSQLGENGGLLLDNGIAFINYYDFRSNQAMLKSVSIENLTALKSLGSLVMPSSVKKLALGSEGLLYAAYSFTSWDRNKNSGLASININDPANLSLQKKYDTSGSAGQVVMLNHYAIVGVTQGLQTISTTAK